MKENFTFQQKTKLLTKLFDAGCNTEKKLQQLDMESILKIPGITIPDMSLIIELQKQTKANKLFSYLGGGTDEQAVRNRMTAISFGATLALTLMIGESLWRNCIPDIPMMSFTTLW